LSGAASKTATADASGNYTFAGLANGTYTVTPTLANRTMTPASRSVTVNGANVTGTNFTATATNTSGTPEVDVTVGRDYSSSVSSLITPVFSTQSTNELLVAFVSTDDARSKQSVKKITGGGIVWRIATRSSQQGGTSEIWYAFAAQKLTSVSVTATLAQRSEAQITVMSFSNVDTANSGYASVGAVVASNASNGAPTAAITPTRRGSLIVGVGNDPRNAITRVPVTGQSIKRQLLVPYQGTMWVQAIDQPTEAAGTMVSLRNSSPTWSSYNYAAIEVRGTVTATSSSLTSTQTDTSSVPVPPVSEDTGSAVAAAAVTLVQPATFQAADVCSPGGLATLLGNDFTSQKPLSITNAALPTVLNGVRVRLNGQDARLMLVGPNQINFQCPDLAPGTALDLAVLGEQGQLQRANMSVMQTASPALFTLSESTQAVVQRLGENSANGPIRAGDRIRLFLSGLGSVKQPVAVGEITPSDRPIAITNTLTAIVNGVEIAPAFAGLAPGTVGLYHVDVQLPDNAQAGTEIPVSVKLRTADGREFLSNLGTLKISQPVRSRN
jgi:uncharacterized protein (TIGR03437 family)